MRFEPFVRRPPRKKKNRVSRKSQDELTHRILNMYCGSETYKHAHTCTDMYVDMHLPIIPTSGFQSIDREGIQSGTCPCRQGPRHVHYKHPPSPTSIPPYQSGTPSCVCLALHVWPTCLCCFLCGLCPLIAPSAVLSVPLSLLVTYHSVSSEQLP